MASASKSLKKLRPSWQLEPRSASTILSESLDEECLEELFDFFTESEAESVASALENSMTSTQRSCAWRASSSLRGRAQTWVAAPAFNPAPASKNLVHVEVGR